MPDKRKPKNYRVLPGTLASPELERWAMRTLLLEEAARMYPEMRAELLRLAEEFSSGSSVGDLELRDDRIAAYCRKWGLVDGREPARWAAEVVERTLHCAIRAGLRWPGWRIHYAQYAPAAGDRLYEPDVELVRQARARLPAQRWGELKAVLEAWRENGWRPVRQRRSFKVVKAAVRHQFGGEPWKAIAAAEVGSRLAAEYAGTVKEQARELLRAAGLRRPGGRASGG